MMNNSWNSKTDSIKKALLLPVGELYADFGGTAVPKKVEVISSKVKDCVQALKNECSERIICSTQAEIIAQASQHNLDILPSQIKFLNQ
jgi:hypothetical protein